MLILALWMALTLGRRRAAGVALSVAVVGGGSLWWHASLVVGPPRAYFAPISALSSLSRLAALPLVVAGDALAQADARARAAIRAAHPLPALDGSVDVYPTEQAMVLAHGLQYRPRPVFQSYMAYTPALEAANAAALRGPAAPDWVLFHLRPIDGRLPALDDAASWPELLARYRWAGVAGDMAVLQRRADPRPWHVEAAVPFHAVAGEWIALPAATGDLVWLRASLAQGGARARALAALFEAPLTWIRLRFADGSERRYRLVPALAPAGFVVSPLVSTTPELAALFGAAGAPQPPAVQAFRFEQSRRVDDDPEPQAADGELSRLVIE